MDTLWDRSIAVTVDELVGSHEKIETSYGSDPSDTASLRPGNPYVSLYYRANDGTFTLIIGK